MHHSSLYTPADRRERVIAALRGELAVPPDVVIADLEDGVAVSAKTAARDAVPEIVGAVRDGGPELHVRINSGPLMADDVEALIALRSEAGASGQRRIGAIVLPKATVASVEALAARLDDARSDVSITALVESAHGVLDAPALARHPRVARLALGEADLCADLGMTPSPDGTELQSIRVAIVVASAAAGIEPPVGPVSTDFTDLDALAVSTSTLRRLGFGARSAIHPAQLAVIRDAFTPSDDELAAARALVEAFDAAVAEGRGAAVGPDGRMIDEAVVRSARRLLA